MHNTDIVGQLLNTGLRAVKKAIANLMGIKRLAPGAHFAEVASTTEAFVGERQHNMGDLWREPSDAPTLLDSAPSNYIIGE